MVDLDGYWRNIAISLGNRLDSLNSLHFGRQAQRRRPDL
jgi:hypothetical protein